MPASTKKLQTVLLAGTILLHAPFHSADMLMPQRLFSIRTQAKEL